MISTALKYTRWGLVIAGIVGFTACNQASQSAESQEETSETSQSIASPRAMASSDIDGVNVKIDWGSPSVKGREIWGDLVPYDEVWRAGANETTNVEFASDVVIGETPVAAGKYGIFIIPRQEGAWTVVLNTAWSREEHGIWGSNGYDEANDVARVDVEPTWSDENIELLGYNVAQGAIEFSWEKVRLSVPVAGAN